MHALWISGQHSLCYPLCGRDRDGLSSTPTAIWPLSNKSTFKTVVGFFHKSCEDFRKHLHNGQKTLHCSLHVCQAFNIFCFCHCHFWHSYWQVEEPAFIMINSSFEMLWDVYSLFFSLALNFSNLKTPSPSEEPIILLLPDLLYQSESISLQCGQ